MTRTLEQLITDLERIAYDRGKEDGQGDPAGYDTRDALEEVKTAITGILRAAESMEYGRGPITDYLDE